jgi:hypothetical protein
MTMMMMMMMTTPSQASQRENNAESLAFLSSLPVAERRAHTCSAFL